MADGNWKAIETVAIGDLVRGAHGTVNRVLALDQPLLGNRPLYLINGELYNTADHMMWTGKGFAVISKKAYLSNDYRQEVLVIVDRAGRKARRTYIGVDPAKVGELAIGDRLAYGDQGTRPIESLDEDWGFAPQTQLYALVLDGSHTMQIAGGYVVSGWARDDDFDYDTWKPKAALVNADGEPLHVTA